ncbi:MAG: hypothetical protein U5K75_12040 [Ahrensia sp.]|nr:hypothetical protein [Ahrensia sp.]
MTLVSRATDLAAAVRDKINLMVPRLLPSGGGTGQVLSKTSATDNDVAWTSLGNISARTITIDATAPASPAVGDIWVDPT